MIPPWSGRDRRPFIIAEIGVNHDGSVPHALMLVDAAATAGADAIKLQCFQTDLLMSRAALLAAYQKQAGEEDPFAMLRRLELTIDAMAPIVERAVVLGLAAIVTVFSVDLVPHAEALPWSAYKTASPDIIHRPLLEALERTGRPIILSTGASDLAEVERAVSWLTPAHDRLAVLQCVSSYPTPMSSAAIGGMIALTKVLDVPVGYSDHTAEVRTGAIAVAHGAEILEKHLTYDRTATGPDHAASLDPAQFARYVALAREAGCAAENGRSIGSPLGASSEDSPSIGSIAKVVLDIERDVRLVSRQSLVAARDIMPNDHITPGDLTIKRPGTGLAPFLRDAVLGKIARRPIARDMPIAEDDLA